MKGIIAIIITVTLISSCGRDEDLGNGPPVIPPTKYVYCTQEDGYKLCEVRLESQPSMFDKYTNTVLFGSVQEVNEIMSDKNSPTRLKE